MDSDELELGHYGRIFRRSWWMIVLAMVAFALLAVLFLPSQQDFFESRATVQLVPSEADVGQGNDPVVEETEALVAASLGDRVVEQSPFDDLTFDDWTENIAVSPCLDTGAVVLAGSSCDTQILEFLYRSDVREEAQTIVQLSADVYLEARNERAQTLRDNQVGRLEAQLADLDLRIANEEAVLGTFEQDSVEYNLADIRLRRLEPERLEVRSTLNQLESTPVEVGRVLSPASTPERDSSGIPLPIALAAGLLMGLFIGGSAAVLSDRLDRRLSSAAETEVDLGVPVLGNIPRITEDSPALVTAVSSHTPGAEAFRRLAAAALAPRNGYVVDSITVTGANEKEGRTTAAVNMALALAQSGRQVLLVAADRRNTAVDRLFGLNSQPGLNDFLRTNVDLEAARVAIGQCEERLGIHVLPTGTGSPPPLSSNGLSSLLTVAQERNMMVVFDSPPALTHADGLQLASVADAVYILAAFGRTRRSELTELRVQLLNVQADIAGAIINRTSRLSILPSGAADVGTVRVPTGVPGTTPQPGRGGDGTFESLQRLAAPSEHVDPEGPPGPPQATPVEARSPKARSATTSTEDLA